MPEVRAWVLAVFIASLAPPTAALAEFATVARAAQHEAIAVEDDLEVAPDNATSVVDGHSLYAMVCQTAMMLVYVVMVSCAPVLREIVDSGARKAVKVHWRMVSCFFTLTLVFMYAMTNVIQFTSVHWDGEGHLTVVEAMYMFSQVLTSAGYGDIFPAGSGSQNLIGLLVVASLVHRVATVAMEVCSVVGDHTQEYSTRLLVRANTRLADMISSEQGNGRPAEKALMTSSRDFSSHPAATSWKGHGGAGERKRHDEDDGDSPLPLRNLVCAVLTFLSLNVGGATFFALYPGENITLREGLYFAVVTLSTVGFGDITVKTSDGMLFCSFWMLFGQAAFVWIIGSATELLLGSRARLHHDVNHARGLFDEYLDTVDSGVVDRHEYLKFAIISSGSLSAADVESIEANFTLFAKTPEAQIPISELRTNIPTGRLVAEPP